MSPLYPRTLDADSYPHIMDAIIAATSRPAMLVLRTTDHETRSRVDKHLAHHLSIRVTDPRFREPGKSYHGLAPVEVCGRGDRMPLFRGWYEGGTGGKEDGPGGERDWGAGDRDAERRKKEALANTRALDVIGTVDPEVLGELWGLFPSDRLPTLRMRCDEDTMMASAGCIAFSPHPPKDTPPTVVVFTDLPTGAVEGNYGRRFPRIPYGTIRLVVNIAFNPSEVYMVGRLGKFVWARTPTTVQQVVIVLHPDPATSILHPFPPLVRVPWTPWTHWMLPKMEERESAPQLGEHVLSMKQTFVGLDSVRLRGRSGAVSFEEGQVLVVQNLQTKYHELASRHSWSSEQQGVISDNTSYLTMDEYRASVSAEDFALETQV